MPIVKCPSCPAKYDPGLDDDIKDIPAELSMKVVCPNCGQWVRLPEQEKVDPPNVPEEVLREMRSQSRLVELVEKPTSKARRVEEEEEERPRSSRRRDEEDGDLGGIDAMKTMMTTTAHAGAGEMRTMRTTTDQVRIAATTTFGTITTISRRVADRRASRAKGTRLHR